MVSKNNCNTLIWNRSAFFYITSVVAVAAIFFFILPSLPYDRLIIISAAGKTVTVEFFEQTNNCSNITSMPAKRGTSLCVFMAIAK